MITSGHSYAKPKVARPVLPALLSCFTPSPLAPSPFFSPSTLLQTPAPSPRAQCPRHHPRPVNRSIIPTHNVGNPGNVRRVFKVLGFCEFLGRAGQCVTRYQPWSEPRSRTAWRMWRCSTIGERQHDEKSGVIQLVWVSPSDPSPLGQWVGPLRPSRLAGKLTHSNDWVD